MDESIRFVSSLPDQKRIESEMLYAVLLDEATYPWNPADLVAAICLDNLTASIEANIPPQLFSSRWHSFSRQAEQLWACG